MSETPLSTGEEPTEDLGVEQARKLVDESLPAASSTNAVQAEIDAAASSLPAGAESELPPPQLSGQNANMGVMDQQVGEQLQVPPRDPAAFEAARQEYGQASGGQPPAGPAPQPPAQ